MADKHLAYDTRKNTDLFSDDDPLAELARIVGFEPRVAANTVADAPKQEPAFDLEDELLREFERYDAPRPAEPVVGPAEPVAAQQAAPQMAPPFAPYQDYHDEQPVQNAEPPMHFDDPWFDRGADALPDVEHLHESHSVPVAAPTTATGARDLIEELEMSIGSGAATAQSSSKAPQWSAATIRLPLANFHRAPDAGQEKVLPAEPKLHLAPAMEEAVPAAAAVAEPVIAPAPMQAAEHPADVDRHEDAYFDAADAAMAALEQIAVESQAHPVVDEPAADEPAQAAAMDFTDHQGEDVRREPEAKSSDSGFAFDIDDLLNDVAKYPALRRAPAADNAYAPGNAFAPAYRVPDAVSASPVAPVAVVPQPVSRADADDPFSGHDFELDLEGIELELTDLDFVEAAEPVKAEAPKAPAPYVAPQMLETRRPTPVAEPAKQDFEFEEDLPFDPAMISDADHHPEAVEMHVPSLPPAEQHEPVVPAHDFDFDVDAELANLLAATPVKEHPAKAPAAPAWSASASAPMAPAAMPSYDDFEKALEDDFRRSVTEPVQRKDTVSHLRIESASRTEDKHRARSMKRLLAAAASVLLFSGMAYGGYSFLSKGGISLAGGEPKVILADKDPIKVVPENPGGKTVPNQDKAVYDSVGGAPVSPPKQKSLMSNDVQPLDVVQRTLTPETSPEDDGGEVVTGTPVGDTEDPRLLPAQVAVGDPAAEQSPSMAARKVRTMVVRGDGTLVPRDELPASNATNSPPVRQVQSQRVAPAATMPTMPGATEVASAAALPPVTQPAKPALAPQAAVDTPLEKVAAADPANVQPPLNRVQSAPVKDIAPVPGARPAQPAPDAQAPKRAQPPKEVASAVPPAAQTTAAAGGYGMQIASLPSEDEAKRSYASLTNKFGTVIRGRPYEIRKVEVPGKGTYYRLRIQASTKDEAADLCVKYRAAGGTCLISK